MSTKSVPQTDTQPSPLVEPEKRVPTRNEINFAVGVAEAQRAPIALAPLRWNLVKLGRTWDAKISTFMAQATKQKSELLKSHRTEMSKHNKKSKQAFEKAKDATPINKRLLMMEMSYENLVFAKQTNRAESLKRRLDPMVSSFYRKELATHIASARQDTHKLKGKMEGERARLDVDLDHQVKRMMAEKDSELKFLRRKNMRSSDDPFSLHFAAISGEMTRLDTMLSRPKILQNIDMRDPDSGWTALHFAARNGQVPFAMRLIDCKACVNALGPNDETPLHLASGWGTREMVGLLLQCGADKKMKYLEKTPYDIAKENMRQDIAKLLGGWMPIGLGYKKMAELSEPPPKDYSEEPSPKIASQLRALDMKIGLNGRFHEGLIHSYTKLLTLYRDSSPPRYEEAIDSGKRVVEIRKHLLQSLDGVDLSSASPPRSSNPSEDASISLASAMNNLGEVCHSAQDYPLASRYLSAALDSMSNLRGPSHPSTMPVLLNYANHLLEAGSYHDSLPLLLRYLSYQRDLHTHEMGSPSLALVPTLDLLSYCCLLCGRYQDGWDHLEQGTSIVESNLGPKHVDMSGRHEKAGFLMFCKGERKRAEEEYIEARDILREHGAEEFDEDIMRLENNIAVTLCAGGRQF